MPVAVPVLVGVGFPEGVPAGVPVGDGVPTGVRACDGVVDGVGVDESVAPGVGETAALVLGVPDVLSDCTGLGVMDELPLELEVTEGEDEGVSEQGTIELGSSFEDS